jgi:mannitol 2-dehydrogenase
VIADNLAAGRSIEGLALESALWCRYCAGTTGRGHVIEANDPIWDRLKACAHTAKDDPQAWLGMADIYGEVGRSPAMQAAFGRWLDVVWRKGAEEALRAYIS